MELSFERLSEHIANHTRCQYWIRWSSICATHDAMQFDWLIWLKHNTFTRHTQIRGKFIALYFGVFFLDSGLSKSCMHIADETTWHMFVWHLWMWCVRLTLLCVIRRHVSIGYNRVRSHRLYQPCSSNLLKVRGEKAPYAHVLQRSPPHCAYLEKHIQ